MPPLIQHISLYFPSVLLQLYCVFLPAQPLQFDRFSIQDGLSESMVRCIEQDDQGFLWFGTADGLNRFDGYEFVVYKHDPDDPASLCDNNVWKVLADKQGKLWIGTSAGLCLFDKKRQGFIRFTPDGGEQKANNSIQALCESRNGKLWVGTSGGLFIFDRVEKVFIPISIGSGKEKVWVSCILEDHRGDIWVGTKDDGLFGIVQPGNRVIHYQWEKEDTNSISGSWISALFEDSDCQLWVSAKFGGICQIDPGRNSVHRFPSNPKAPYNQNNITSMLEDSDGNFWLGSQIGLFQIEPKSGRIQHFQHQSDNGCSLSTNSISCMFEDRDGGMWIGTWEDGINYWNKHRKSFFYHPLANEKGKETHLVKALEKTEDGNLWIGADGSGLYCWDQKEGTTRHWEQPDNPQSNQIWAILKDQKGWIWLGTRNGIYRFHPDKSNLQNPHAPFSGIHFQPEEKAPFSLSHRDVSCLFEDSRGRIWAGTLNGVNRFDSRQKKFVPYFHEDGNPHSLSNNWIWVIFEGQDGKIWIGTNNGLNQFDEEKDNFIRFFHDPKTPNGLSNNNIWDIYEDIQGNLWIGTTGGLNRYQAESGQFSVWRSKDGLKNDNITNILEDKQGNLWLTNFQGLSKFGPRTGAIENFEPFHLQPSSYSRTFIETQSGEMIYGVRGGLVLFHPDSINNNPIRPTIVITGFDLHVDHSVAGEPSDSINSRPAPPKVFYDLSKGLVLKHWQNDFSISFAALNYLEPEKNQYRYRIKGYQKRWMTTDANHRIATYTNLKPGHYTFQVMGSNNDGAWCIAPASFDLEIRPPWWATHWAYISYALLALTLLAVIYHFQKRRWQLQQQLEWEHREAKRIRELDAWKSRFYTNITHEFRTPLTIILGMAEQIKNQPETWFNEGLQMIKRNGNNLLHLINQMLDLSKLEAGMLSTQMIQDDVIVFLKYVVESFHSLAEGKNIELAFKSEWKKLLMDYDPEKLREILSNLLSNAIKFTGEGGAVIVEVSVWDNKGREALNIAVKDNGPGIPPKAIGKIFDRFYQAPTLLSSEEKNPGIPLSRGAVGRGTGIGLALARELVKMLGGEISVESEPGKGSVFTVCLPIQREADPEPVVRKSGVDTEKLVFPPPLPATSPTKEDTAEPLLLIIEDNRDVARYLTSCLQQEYQLDIAQGGIEGVEKALEKTPDIIISDVMMPVMDGFEVCEKLKNDFRTSHIPIILLTAKADLPSKIEGLKKGADAYLPKPFHKQELLVQLQNLMDSKKRLQERYRSVLPPSTYDQNFRMEDAFMQQVHQILEAHLADAGFDIFSLCQELGMSRSQLYRKFSTLSGQPVGQYFRSLRMNKAKELLRTSGLNISEIAYEVGFKDPAHFTHAFKETFGMNPSEARKT